MGADQSLQRRVGFCQAGASSVGNGLRSSHFLTSDSHCHNILRYSLKVQLVRRYQQNTEIMVLFALINILKLLFLPPSALPLLETQL